MNTTQTQEPLPAPVPVIDVKRIDKVLKKLAQDELLIDGELAIVVGDSDKPNAKCTNVGRCAIGGLLIAAGFPAKFILEGNFVGESGSSSRASRLLKREYGLHPILTEAIERVNDGVHCSTAQQTERYEEVLALVSLLDVMQEQGIRFDSSQAAVRMYRDGEDTAY